MRFIVVKYCRDLISDLQTRLGEARLQPRANDHFQLGQGKLQIESRAMEQKDRICQILNPNFKSGGLQPPN